MSRILLISYFYPPTRDTGAQRPAAMAAHLAALGHEVVVLTTTAFGPGDDAPGPGAPRVLRARDLQALRARLAGHERIDSLFDSDSYGGKPHPLSYVIVPEPLAVAWAPFARRLALAEHRARPFDAVISTSPPESAHLVARALSRRGVPWVADVRDAWTFEPLRPRFPTALQRRWDERLERRVLARADAVVCVSEPAAADLRDRGIADPVVIANAWDPRSDPPATAVEAATAELDPDRVSLLYAGRFGSYGRDPAPFAAALARLASADPGAAARLEIVIAGPLTPSERELFGRSVAPISLRLLGSVERRRALALERAADALLLIAQPTRSQLVNFKLFEYLAAGRPILALAAGTEAGRIAAEAGVEPVVAADDPAAIAAALARVVAGDLGGPDPVAAERHRYPAAAERMAAVVERISSAGGERHGRQH